MQQQQNQLAKEQHKANNFQFHCLNKQFSLGEPIAQGSYGSIYYGMDSNNNLKAFKIIKMNTGKPHIQKSLKQQDQAMKNCQNQYVVRYDKSFQDANKQVKIIVMDLCDYFSLQDIIFLKGHFEQPQAKIYLKNILCGLISMHHFGYSHRDIKSSNICIINDRCVIIDFGCSKQFVNTQPGQQFNLTRIKQATIIGTVINKSPQMLSKGKYTYRTDFYSIGILYYQMLTGVTPFDLKIDDSDQAILQKINQNIKNIFKKQYIMQRINSYATIVPSFKNRANPIISESAQRFLSKLIAIDPNDRFSEEQIKNNLYLKDNQSTYNIWEMAKCVFPLRDQNWQKFIETINFSMKNKVKQTSKEIEVSIQQSIISCIQLPQEDAKKLKKVYNEKTQRDFIAMAKARIIYFQIKRIKLLIKLKSKLKQLNEKCNDLQCQEVIMLISEYCLKRSAYINGQYFMRKRQVSRKSSIYIGQKIFHNQIQKYYTEDKNNYLISKPNITQKQIINKTQNQINQEYKILYLKLKSKNLLQNDQQIFFQHSQTIFYFQYKPSDKDFQWIQFESFKTILNYAKMQQKQTK